MQLSDIREEVKLTVQDITFTDDVVDSYINDIYFAVVASCLVPELKGIDTVTTVLLQPYASMSGVTGGFSGVLSRVYNSDNRSLLILYSLEALMDLKGNLIDPGSVEVVALEGSTLWYYPTPAVAEVLTVIYYRNPMLLINDSSVPDAIPDFLHRQILVHGAASLCYDKIEGGVEGLKVNTKSHEIEKLNGVMRFREWLGKNRKHYIVSQEPM